MKRLLHFAGVVLLMSINLSCSNQEVSLKQTALSKEEVIASVESNILYVTKIERKTEDETVDLTNSPDYNPYREILFFIFRSGFVQFYTGKVTPNNQFPATAQTFTFQTKITYPLSIKYHWDDAKGTVAAHSYAASTLVQPLPVDVTAFLDVSSIIRYKTIEEAKAAQTPPSLKFTFSTLDTKLGEVTYIYTLKPAWLYEERTVENPESKFVVF